MANLNDNISGFVAGDTLEVRRTITGIPAGQTISKAWLMVKIMQTDVDASAIITKEITDANQAGIGHVTDTGGDGTGEVRFDLTPANTALLVSGNSYAFGIKIRTSTGNLYTPFKGTISAEVRIIQDEA